MRRLVLNGRTTVAAIALAVAATLILALPTKAFAKDIYVSMSGSDVAGDGLSPAKAFATIQHAIDVATYGDTVQVGTGTFTGTITMKDGVSLRGAGSHETTLTGYIYDNIIKAQNIGTSTSISDFTIGGSRSNFGIVCDYSSPRITNIIITNSVTIGISCNHSSSPSITNNIVMSSLVCIESTDASSSPRIADNTISGRNQGIYCMYSSSPSITGNTIKGASRGIECYRASPTIVNNVISGGTYGIYCTSSSPRITNNTLTLSDYGIYCTDLTSTPSITNCIVWGNGDDLSRCFATYSDIGIPSDASGLGNITAIPNFANAAAGDFHLSAGSPCIDAGTSGGAPTVDKDGNRRPDGSRWDMGAYEFKRLDITSPATISNVLPYYATAATIRFAATDNASGSGVAHTYYALNGGAPVEGTTVAISGAGTYTLTYWSVDAAGNTEAAHTVKFTVIAKPSSKGYPSTPASIATLRHGKPFTVYGYVIKHTSGTYPVTLQFYRYQSGHWVLRKSTPAKASTVLTFSRYSRATSAPYSGKWRVRARHKVGTKHLYSGWRYFTAS